MKNCIVIYFICLFLVIGKNEMKGQIAPDSSNGKYSFHLKTTYFEISRNEGARISSLKMNGKEIMYVDKSGGNNNWGSTFWPSPQSAWGWPPSAILDKNPYAAITKANGVIMESGISAAPSYSFKKTFSASNADTSISIRYTIKNHNAAVSQVAPWEITRVPSGGLTFFPRGTTPMRGALFPLMKDSIGIIWFDYDSTKIPTGVPKLFSDGSEGWIAHVNNDRILLIKKFTDTPASLKAPEEDEIEIYADPTKLYVEIEQQGAYSSLNAGATSNWNVKWIARKLPEGIPIEAGNQKLAHYVRSVIARQRHTK